MRFKLHACRFAEKMLFSVHAGPGEIENTNERREAPVGFPFCFWHALTGTSLRAVIP